MSTLRERLRLGGSIGGELSSVARPSLRLLLAGYHARVFTEFMEQRSPGRTVLDDKLYRKGLLGLLRDIDGALEALDFREAEALARQEELRAMAICARAVIGLAGRCAAGARAQAPGGADAARRGELLLCDLARIAGGDRRAD